MRNESGRRKDSRPARRRAARSLLLLPALAMMPGCVMAGPQKPPTALEQKFFIIATNYVTEVRYETNAVTVTNVISGVPVPLTSFQVSVITNITPNYHFTPSANAEATAATAGAATNLFAPGFGGAVTTLLGGLFGLWSALRSRRAQQTSAALAQIIETGQAVLQSAPNGAALSAAWKSWMIKHQAQAGVIAEASKLVANVVDTDDARSAAEQIVKARS